MRTRKVCREKGHDLRQLEGIPLPVIFCRRWFCDGSAPAPWVGGPMRDALQRAIDADDTSR